ncbi:MAG TPA: hypothetical protein VKG62_06770 [Solirubrobacteraceae bacterium]|nr:hypothetical protein [Solirubrobacteraceae bacterium]
MDTRANFPDAAAGTGMYESFYLRAFSPEEPVGVWIRYTVHKRPGSEPTGSLWCTLFDARSGAPFMHKLTTERPRVPPGGWIAVAESELGPGRAEGRCGEASWELSFSSGEPPLYHLSPAFLYRTPLPRTKLTSPAPAARFGGVFELAGRGAIVLEGWQGMVGHNWGTEHAERWIWLHGMGFDEAPEAWIDVALGRVLIAGRLTPWIASGALSLAGRRTPIGGLPARGQSVAEGVASCRARLKGRGGTTIELRVQAPADSTAGWRYADPDGGEHDVLNCSVAALELTVGGGGAREPRRMRTEHGGAYELGMRERDHGVAIAPFPDG